MPTLGSSFATFMTLCHRLSSIVCAVAIAIATLEAQQLPTSSPQSQGLAPERLERLHAFLTEEIDAKHYSGAVLLVARNGRVVDWRAFGLRDCEAGLAMEKDTIVRIYSMSKIVTTVAAMLLVEDGRIRLDDPVEKYLPALAKMRVWTGGTEKKPVLVPAKRPITIKHLLTHTSGFIYGFGNEPIDKRYQKADPYASSSMDAFVAAMARLPLAFQPGDKFGYGFGIDLAGAVVEKVTGQSLDRFVAARITGPLGMADTAYSVPSGKRARLAKIYSRDKSGALKEADVVASVNVDGVGFARGGAGMFSTVADFARFGQMLLNGGELDGTRVLARKSTELMMANQLVNLAQPTMEAGGGYGFGYGGGVRVNLGSEGVPGSLGQFGWSGAATTYFNIDPKENTMVLLFMQHFPYNEDDVFARFSAILYSALVK
jgi:CubicO group peptidase (beta-lactamase class C family)